MILVNGVIDFFYCPTTLVFSEPLCRQLQLQMQLDIPLLAAFPSTAASFPPFLTGGDPLSQPNVPSWVQLSSWAGH